MQGIFSNLTAALLALHTVLGCCWHHAHNCAEACEATAVVASPSESAHDCEHRTETLCDSHSHEHHGQHECLGNLCVFLGFSKAPIPKPAFSCGGSPFALTSNVDHSSFYPEVARPAESPDALIPSLRRHLICCVLLI